MSILNRMDLFDDKVSKTESALMQCAPENKRSTEKNTNTFTVSQGEQFKPHLKGNKDGDDNFEYDNSHYPPGATFLNTQGTEKFHENLEQIIQESVSRSTARLLTKNTLKYLDKGLLVNVGEGVSQQFSVRKPEANKSSRFGQKKTQEQTKPTTREDNWTFETGPFRVDPKLSSFKLHTGTYNMYKMYDNLRSFEIKSPTQKLREITADKKFEKIKKMYSKDLEEEIDIEQFKKLVSSFDEEQEEKTNFETKVTRNTGGTISTALPEDGNSFSTSSNLNSGEFNAFLKSNSSTFHTTKTHELPLNKSKSLDVNQVNYTRVLSQSEKASAGTFEEDKLTADTSNTLEGPKENTDNHVTRNEGNYEHESYLHNLQENENEADEEAEAKDQKSKSDHQENTKQGWEEQEVKEKRGTLYSCFANCRLPQRSDFEKENVQQQEQDQEQQDNFELEKEKENKLHEENVKNNTFKPAFVTRLYAPVDRTQLLPKKRAVVVGCNYLGNPDAQLRGSCNDAFAFSQLLVKKYNFDPKNVILLIDTRPSPAYTRKLSQTSRGKNENTQGNEFQLDLSKIRNNVKERNVYPTKKTSMFGRHLVERNLKHLTLNENMYLDSVAVPSPKEMHPTRGNIFKALKWLNFASGPKDTSLFYYSGHSVQVDDLSGYEGDGFDEALVPLDFETNGLVTCHDLKCLFQSIGAESRLNVFLDTCNLQTVVGGSSKSGPVKGSKMKGFWPFTEPTGKLEEYNCPESVYKDTRMMNQMTRLKYLPAVQVESVTSLSDVQMSLDATHGEVNYVVFSSSNLKGVSVECLFKPLNLESWDTTNKANNQWVYTSISKDEPYHTVRDDEVVVHGAFTYALLLTLMYDKSQRRGGLGLDELLEGTNKKLSQLKKLRLPKLNQEAELLFYHSSKIAKNAFVFPPQFNTYQHKYTNTGYGYLLPNEAWMLMVEHGRQRAKEQQEKFQRMKTDLITLTNLNSKMYAPVSTRSKVNEGEFHENTMRMQENLSRTPMYTGRGTFNTERQAQNLNQSTRGGNKVFEVSVKPMAIGMGMTPSSMHQGVTGRSLTNNISARVFTRNPSISERMTARSKSAMLNLTASTSGGSTNNYGSKFGKFNEVVESHNWYGGCTVSYPYNDTHQNKWEQNNYYHQPTYYADYNTNYKDNSWWNNQNNYNQYYYRKFENMPVYEPITEAMLQQLPTTHSFTVLPQYQF